MGCLMRKFQTGSIDEDKIFNTDEKPSLVDLNDDINIALKGGN